jgi:hypothetical protein
MDQSSGSGAGRLAGADHLQDLLVAADFDSDDDREALAPGGMFMPPVLSHQPSLISPQLLQPTVDGEVERRFRDLTFDPTYAEAAGPSETYDDTSFLFYRSTFGSEPLELHSTICDEVGDEGNPVTRSLASASSFAPSLFLSQDQCGELQQLQEEKEQEQQQQHQQRQLQFAPSSMMLPVLDEHEQDASDYRGFGLMEEREETERATTHAPSPPTEEQHESPAAEEPPATSDLLVTGGGDVFDAVLAMLAHPGTRALHTRLARERHGEPRRPSRRGSG